MNTRLKQFIAAENITQAQLADTINVVRASVSHILAGRNKPSYEFISGLMRHYPNLNMEWLMFGKGKMYKNASAEGPDEAAAQVSGDLFADAANHLRHQYRNRYSYPCVPDGCHQSALVLHCPNGCAWHCG